MLHKFHVYLIYDMCLVYTNIGRWTPTLRDTDRTTELPIPEFINGCNFIIHCSQQSCLYTMQKKKNHLKRGRKKNVLVQSDSAKHKNKKQTMWKHKSVNERPSEGCRRIQKADFWFEGCQSMMATVTPYSPPVGTLGFLDRNPPAAGKDRKPRRLDPSCRRRRLTYWYTFTVIFCTKTNFGWLKCDAHERPRENRSPVVEILHDCGLGEGRTAALTRTTVERFGCVKIRPQHTNDLHHCQAPFTKRAELLMRCEMSPLSPLSPSAPSRLADLRPARQTRIDRIFSTV